MNAEERSAEGGAALPEAQAPTPTPEPLPLPQAVGFEPADGTAGPDRRRRSLFLAAWLASAVAVGAASGFGILAVTDSSKSAATPAAPSVSPKPESGVRADGTHFGSIRDFLLPVTNDYKPGPDEGELGSDAAITPAQLDSQVSLLFGTLPPSDMTSAKGAMEAGHMKDGAVRTYTSKADDLNIAVTALQLDPSMAAKSTGDFTRIVKQSSRFRTGPAVPGHADAVCVLPATRPGDKLDEMTCLATVGDTFVIVVAAGVVPMDQQGVTEMFAQQLDLFENGPKK